MFNKVFLTVASLLLATPVFAAPVTYIFQSDTYTQLSYASSGPAAPGGYQTLGPYGIAQRTSIAFTLDSALAANSTTSWSGSGAQGLPANVLAYSASTGLHSFSMDEEISLRVTTDASGSINAWDIFLHSAVLADDTTLWSRMDASTGGQAVTDVQYQNEYSIATSAARSGPAIGGESSRATAFAGTWSILNPQTQTTIGALSPAATPLGGTGTLLLSGLGLMGLWRWRRRNAA